MCDIFFIHSSVSERFNWFCILGIVNNVAMNIGVLIAFHIVDLVFFGKIFNSGIAGLCGSSVFNFFEECLYCFL